MAAGKHWSMACGTRPPALAATVQTSSGVDGIRVEHGPRGRRAAARWCELPAEQVILALPAQDAAHLLGSDTAPKLAQQVAAMVPVHIALSRRCTRAAAKPWHARGFRSATASLCHRAVNRGTPGARRWWGRPHFKQLDPREPTDPHQGCDDQDALLDRVQARLARRAASSDAAWPAHAGQQHASAGEPGRPWPPHRPPTVKTSPNVYLAGDWWARMAISPTPVLPAPARQPGSSSANDALRRGRLEQGKPSPWLFTPSAFRVASVSWYTRHSATCSPRIVARHSALPFNGANEHTE